MNVTAVTPNWDHKTDQDNMTNHMMDKRNDLPSKHEASDLDML